MPGQPVSGKSGPDDVVEVGRTFRAHGVHGDLAMQFVSDRPERHAVGARLRIGQTWVTVASARDAGTRWLVHLEGVDDRNAAERLANLTVYAVPLADRGDGLYVDELIGAEVVEAGGVRRGRCVSVIENPAHDLLELDSGALVPVVFVTALENGVIIIDPPEGLFDLD